MRSVRLLLSLLLFSLLLLSRLLLSQSAAWGAAYYVATTGLNTNPNSSAQP